MPTIVDTYLNHVRQQRRQYGEKTFVLLECGSFYEVYDTVSADESPHLRACRDLLGIAVTRKNKADPTSAYLAGIPTQSIRRHFKVLLQHNYTVVVVGQKGTPPNITRDVTQVLSPGCNLSEEVHESTDAGQSVLVTVLFDDDADGDCYAHLATFDTNRGTTQFQLFSVDVGANAGARRSSDHVDHVMHDLCTALHETLQTHLFHELCVYHRQVASPHTKRLEAGVAEFVHQWRGAGKLVHCTADVGLGALSYVFQPDFQTKFLGQVYAHLASPFCDIVERLGLEFVGSPMLATLVLLLRWVKQHDPRLVTDLSRPTSHQGLVRATSNAVGGEVGTGAGTDADSDSDSDTGADSTVRCFNELYAKLDVFERTGADANALCLFKHLNRTQTKMGARLLRERLVHLSTTPAVLQARYALVDGVRTDPETQALLNGNLRSPDLERMYRRFGLANLQPFDVPRIVQAQHDLLRVVVHLAALPATHALRALVRPGLVDRLRAYQGELDGLFDLDACVAMSLTSVSATTVSLFQRGRFGAVDGAVDAYQRQAATLDTLATGLMGLLPNLKLPANTNTWVHVKSNDKDGHWLEVSKARHTKLMVAVAKLSDGERAAFQLRTQWALEDLEYDTRNKTNVKVTGDRIRSHSHALQASQHVLAVAVREEYERQLKRLHATHYRATVEPLMRVVAQVDVAHTSAKLATAQGYVRPVLATDATDPPASFVDAAGLRHPIIERLLAESRKTGYVPNDLRVSGAECYLVYGVNSVGKSSLLKSLALAVVMAQAGLFVAATSFRFRPYTKVFARTGNDDNLHRHHSSFVKEMSESKYLTDHADASSLVIADELCSSTESASAGCVVGSLVTILARRGTSYLFATHQFGLQENPRVKQLLATTLKNVHLHVDFAHATGLMFERTLRPGLPSNRMYGVLVADKVIANAEFTALLEEAKRWYHEQDGHGSGHGSDRSDVPVDRAPVPTPSKYNAKVWVDRCEVCGYAPPTKAHTPLETHHLCEQQTADATGLIDGRFHKNERHNLAVLCRPCHQAIDTGALVIEGHRTTLGGEELVYKWAEAADETSDAGGESVSDAGGRTRYTAAQLATVQACATKTKAPGQNKQQWWRKTKEQSGVPVGYGMFCKVVG